MAYDAIRLDRPPSPKAIAIGVVAVAIVSGLLWFLASSYYVVEADEEAVVLRFGKYASTAVPGLHFKLPFGIDQAIIVSTRLREQEFGFRTQHAGVVTQYDYAPQHERESLMLTGDLNCVVLHWVVRYKVDDAKAYVLNVRDVEGTIRDVSESGVRGIVGDLSVDEVISIARTEIQQQAEQETQEVLKSYDCGILIDTVKLKDATPPESVKPAFNAVNTARQDRDKMINQAEGIRNSRLPAAEGEKEKLIQEAEGYAIRRTNEARGNTARFTAIWTEYQQAADVTRRRLYLETMAKVLPKAGRIFVVDEKQKGILPLLRLNERETP